MKFLKLLTNKQVWIKIGLLIILLTIGGFILKNKRGYFNLSLEQYSSGEEKPQFIFQNNQNELKKNDSSSFLIKIDTKDLEIDSAQVYFKYNSKKIKIDKVEQFLFSKVVNKNIDENLYAIFQSYTNPLEFYKGNEIFAKVSFTAIDTGSTIINLDCDNSLINKNGQNTINCNTTANIEMTISENNSGSNNNPPDNSSNQPPRNEPACKKESPKVPTNLTALSGTYGQVHLSWNKVDNASHYTVTYGLAADKFEYGSPNIGNTDQFNVNGLRPYTKYFFVVTAVNDCASSGYSQIVNAVSGPKFIANNSDTNYGYGGLLEPIPTPKTTPIPTATPTIEPSPTPFENEFDYDSNSDNNSTESANSSSEDWYNPEDSQDSSNTNQIPVPPSNQEKKSSSPLKFILILFVLAGLGFGGFMLYKKFNPDEVPELPPLDSDQGSSLEEIKQEEVINKEEQGDTDLNLPPPPFT